MDNRELLEKWLGDRRRSYADGASLFRTLARPQTKERYGAFIDGGIGNVSDPSDCRFMLLVKILSRIRRDIPRQPALYPAALENVATQEPKVATPGVQEVATGAPSDAEVLREQFEDIEGRMQDNEESVSDLRTGFRNMTKPSMSCRVRSKSFTGLA